MACKSNFGEHGEEDFQPQIFLVAQPMCPSLDDTDLVVEFLDETERDLVFWLAVSGDSIPMTLDHLGELLVRFQTLPLQAGLPVLEETLCPSFPLVALQLAERLLEQVRCVEPLVDRQKHLQRLPAIQSQVLVTGQQDILLPLDVAPLLALEAGVSALSHLVQRIIKVAHHMELVEQDSRLRRFVVRRVAKRFPYVYHRQANAFGLLLAQPFIL